MSVAPCALIELISGPGRNSVRIRSVKAYTTHVAVFDVNHMPQVCSADRNGNLVFIYTLTGMWYLAGNLGDR